MIRPENVQLGTADGPVGRVVRASFMGIQTIHEIEAFGARIEAVEAVTTPRCREGESVKIHLPPEYFLAYTAETGPIDR